MRRVLIRFPCDAKYILKVGVWWFSVLHYTAIAVLSWVKLSAVEKIRVPDQEQASVAVSVDSGRLAITRNSSSGILLSRHKD